MKVATMLPKAKDSKFEWRKQTNLSELKDWKLK